MGAAATLISAFGILSPFSITTHLGAGKLQLPENIHCKDARPDWGVS